MHAPPRTVSSALITTGLALTLTTCGGGSSCPDPRTCAGGTSRVEDLPPLTATAAPAWTAPETGTASPPGDPGFVELHLDISSPMAGYLPPDGDGDLSVFQFVAQNAAQHMARVFGGAEAPVRWVGVGHELRGLGARPQIERGVFDGRSTQLDQSMERVLGDFRSGRADAAALVSDLMATSDTTGPLPVFGVLGDWLRSPDVRSGTFHVGLFGLKADYWGVRVRGCGARAPLGCRFDELRRRWVALEAVEQIPVYVLVLGRGADRVVSVMASLQATVDELNRSRNVAIETRSELLTGATRDRDAEVSCRAGVGGGDEAGPQYALFGNEERQYCCVRDDPVTLSCNVEGGFQPTDARATWAVTPPARGLVAPGAESATGAGDALVTPQEAGGGQEAAGGALPPTPTQPRDIDARIDGTRLTFLFACSVVRCGPAGAGLELSIEATGMITDADAVDWSDWSTETGEIGKTLQLRGFVDAVRVAPERYRLRTPTLLHFPGR